MCWIASKLLTFYVGNTKTGWMAIILQFSFCSKHLSNWAGSSRFNHGQAGFQEDSPWSPNQLCQMKGQWRKAKADEWQANADKHHMCLFYDGLKGVYGPRQNMTMLIITRKKNALITDCEGIRAQHFQYLFSKSTTTSRNVLDSLLRRLGWATSYSQISNTIASMQDGKRHHFLKHRVWAARLCLNDCTILFLSDLWCRYHSTIFQR